MAVSSHSSSSKHVQVFLPSFQPSYVSLISLFLCGILWLKNEATNERLSLLETTSPREISIRSGFANGYFSEKSFRSMEEPRGSLFERTFVQDGSKRLHYPSGKNAMVTLQCKFLVEGSFLLPTFALFVQRIAQLWHSWTSIILSLRGKRWIIWILEDKTVNEAKRNSVLI